jgi:CBS domain-containing protein
MTEKLTRRGLSVPSDYHADVLRTTAVREVMATDVKTVQEDTTVAELAERFLTRGHGAYPIVDGDGRCVGMVARGDLLREAWPDHTTAGEVSTREVVSVSSTTTVIDALRRLVEEEIEHLPVIDRGRLVGICTRTDIMRARRAQFASERSEPGWRRRGRRLGSESQ